MSKPSTAATRRRGLDYSDVLSVIRDEPYTVKIPVSPELAMSWRAFDQGTEEIFNRPTSAQRVERYARDMANNAWLFTGHPLVFDWNGHCRDGGHRIEAIIKSGCTIEFNVTFGVDPSAQRMMDKLRNRTIADDYKIAGVPNAMNVASIGSLVTRWRSGKILNSKWYPTPSEVYEFIDTHPTVNDAAREATRIYRNIPNAAKSVIGAAWHEAHLLDADACDEFFDGLYSGANMERDNPILALRNGIARYNSGPKSKPRQEGQLYQFVKAWNLRRKKVNKTYIVIPATLSSETFPTMV